MTKLKDGWYYYRSTNKTYLMKNGTCIKVIRGYYYEESTKDPGYYKPPTVTKYCPV